VKEEDRFILLFKNAREGEPASNPKPDAAKTETPVKPDASSTEKPSVEARDVKPVTKVAADGEEILVCPAPARPGQTFIDMIMGLVVRAALAIQFGSWMLSNTVRVNDLMDWRSWFVPERGLESAVTIWTMGQVDAQTGALVLVLTAALITLSATLGLFARIAGFLVVIGSLWHAMFVLPEAWPAAFSHGVLGLYLFLRGAGPASLDWILARLSRMS
jgi:hypothetical protein